MKERRGRRVDDGGGIGGEGEGRNGDEGEGGIRMGGEGVVWELHWWATPILIIIDLALVFGITALARSWPRNVWRRHWSAIGSRATVSKSISYVTLTGFLLAESI
jgi:hypothetical protein